MSGPARRCAATSATSRSWKARGTQEYQELATRSLATMKAVEALPAPEPGRKRFDLPEMLPLSVVKQRMR